MLLVLARSLAALAAGADDSPHLQVMLQMATDLGDPIVRALVLARIADRRTAQRRTVTGGPSAMASLVEAIVLLDNEGGVAAHRVSAHELVASTLEELALWELADEHRRLISDLLDPKAATVWDATAWLQRRVNDYNRLHAALDWASAHAVVGDWASAERIAVNMLSTGTDRADDDWPDLWAAEYAANRHLLTAVAGWQELRSDVPAVDAMGLAIRASRSGDHATASALAGIIIGQLHVQIPENTRLWCLSMTVRQPGTSPAAIRYSDELAGLRWQDRLDRLDDIRDVIATERCRHELDRPRQQLIVNGRAVNSAVIGEAPAVSSARPASSC
ncbi:hypothetical protein [Actinoplanes couchii]|uniref:hypothetical protein n=1 Tax=Actinoplanes couchii TaxID=403638 RepID=UPI0028638926|nr:hypothetical protein [Actinoplanes couchii]MDR6324116.1 hypothetical protein [Actinoplanes couchii]